MGSRRCTASRSSQIAEIATDYGINGDIVAAIAFVWSPGYMDIGRVTMLFGVAPNR